MQKKKKKKKLIKKEDIILKNPGTNDLKIRSDSKIFATGGWDSKIRIFAMKNFKPLAVLTIHRDSINSLTFTKMKRIQEQQETVEDKKNQQQNDFSEQNLLAAGSKDTRISLWSLY